MKQNKPSAQTATIREIARRAEVSIASVSRALNGKPGISDALRDKILTISREVAYQPSAAAKSRTASMNALSSAKPMAAARALVTSAGQLDTIRSMTSSR